MDASARFDGLFLLMARNAGVVGVHAGRPGDCSFQLRVSGSRPVAHERLHGELLILCYTIACMPAYRDGTSSAAMCAVMRLIVISEALFITQSGVRAHLSRIYKKVEVHSQEELVRALEGR